MRKEIIREDIISSPVDTAMPNKSAHRGVMTERTCPALKRRAGLHPCDSYRGIRTNAHMCAAFASLEYLRRALWNPVFHARIRLAITSTGNFRGAYAPRPDEKFIAAHAGCTRRRAVFVSCKNEAPYPENVPPSILN